MGDDEKPHPNGDSRRHSEPNLKRRRVTKACDFCHRRGRKCKPATVESGVTPVIGPDGHHSCLTCIEHGAECTWDRKAAKRGVKSKTSPASARQSQSRDASDRWFYDESRHGSRDLVHRLICIFFDTVYPVFPFYDEKSVMREWDESKMSSDRAAFARLMAICALSASHVRDGAMFDPDVVPDMVRDELQQAYLDDGRKAIPEDNRDIPKNEVFQYLQVLGTMSLAAIQIKDDTLFEQYLGRYHNIVAQSQFQFEKHWGDNLTSTEVYVRRQFFWSMYRLEVHSALIQGHVIRCPELQCGVGYPVHVGLSGVLDPTEMPVSGNSANSKTEIFFPGSWLVGWNYITDLYRILEHVIVRMRKARVQAAHTDRNNIDRLLPSIDEMLREVLGRKMKLPLYASQAFPSSTNREENLCGFQVANIACTYQLTRMAAFACENQFEEACGAAIELIDEITKVPPEYLRAIGHPMLQELVGVGHILSSFIGRHLHTHQYFKLRDVMRAMAIFLQNLGSCLPNAPQISGKLFTYITKIDDEINRQNQQQLHVSTAVEIPIPAISSGQQIMQVLPTTAMEQYQLQSMPLMNFTAPMDFMSNVFTTAFNDAPEIDWQYSINNQWTTG
ncbi:hypothetical protein CkaCkLH20_11226 [Colletotrichum karsti]|uniref:Zn(2)-C6 fungal-type domain-containing protein n=1 Tax=Colletotrichum karsti TaxID=1095194 RepID=A0A9P6LG72_9PEZI|nr:uncharacterized protein CkaCkLH20_11226 [Colletotrichum karsti]KAF9871305.1 hypothetical protein CkaCkLH20_11226 [Colletotrichum karsti]